MSLPTEIVNDFYLEVTRGNIPGFSAKELIGVNGDIDAGTEDVWNQGGSITQASTAGVLAASSTSALDITQYVTVTGLDANYDEISEIFGPLTGQTRVVGEKSFLRVNSAVVSSTLNNAASTEVLGELLYASSSSVADVGQIITVVGLNVHGVEISEDFTLNGQNKITGTKKFASVIRATSSAAVAGTVYVYFTSVIVTGIPSTETAIQALICMPFAGKIYVAFNGATAGGVPTDLTKVQAAIDIAQGRAFNALYTVPRNRNWYLTSLRYMSTGAAAAFDVIIEVRQKVFGGTETVMKTIKYLDLGTTNYTSEQIQYTDHPILFPAKSEIRVRGTLAAGGSNLNLTVTANFIEENITAVPRNVSVITIEALAVKMALLATTNVSQNFWLIGVDQDVFLNRPTTVNLDDVLTTITGHAHAGGILQPYVAADTEVAFDPAYFVSGKLVSTTKPAVITIMRTVDSGGNVDYVYAPVNTIIDLGNVKKVKYLTA